MHTEGKNSAASLEMQKQCEVTQPITWAYKNLAAANNKSIEQASNHRSQRGWLSRESMKENNKDKSPTQRNDQIFDIFISQFCVLKPPTGCFNTQYDSM